MTVSGVLVGAVLALPAAAPQARTEQPVVAAAGVLRLHVFGTGGQVTWERDGAVVATQTITSNRCKVAVSGAQLLAITPSTGDVGLVSNGLGVRQRNNCATAEG
ncbi:MAG: hypothetical protein H0W46_01240, partial [Acidimicrobiia bacterium]|nr:hypothetical protein [Acidimicrobiia bacterium]